MQKIRLLIAVFVTLALVTPLLSGAADVDRGQFDKDMQILKTHESGKQTADLSRIERTIAAAAKDATVRSALEQKLLATLNAATTNEAKSFICRCLRTIGTAQSVPALEVLLTDRDVSHMARYALGRMAAPEAMQALQKGLAKTSSWLKAGIINTLVQAGYRKAIPDCIQLVGTRDKVVALAAVKALGRFGGAEAAAALEAARSARGAVDKIDNKNAQARPIIKALETAPNGAKPALLRLLARPATTRALSTVREALKDPDATVSAGAVRALSLWPNPKPAVDLFAIVSTTQDPNQRALALTGYVRLAPLSANPTAMFVKAMELAKQPEEIKQVLKGMTKADTLVALELAEKYMAQDEFKHEACLAAAHIGEAYAWQDPDRATAVFAAIEARTQDGPIRGVIKRSRDEMRRWHGFIFAWKAAGPYKIEGVRSGEQVYRGTYPPEDPNAKGIKWITLGRTMEGDRINLEATFGTTDHVCCYVRTRVWSPAEHEAKLEWSVDDYIKGWLNGQPTNAGDIKLRKGYNDLMLKLGDHEGGWSFRCRILKRDGSPVEGLKFDPR